MKRPLLAALGMIGLAAALCGSAQAQPYPGERNLPPLSRDGGRFAEFDVRNARGWAERLVICDTTAFLASRPDINADRIWVRRDDGRRDLLLPPYFVGAGHWYKQGYERLFWRLRREREVSSADVYRAQDAVGRRFVQTYRDANGRYGVGIDIRFLEAQDRYCRQMARSEGEIIT